MSVSVRPASSSTLRALPNTVVRCRPFSSSSASRVAPRRNQDFNSGFTSTYDPSLESGRGPMFNKATFGVPRFYPRDLKRRIDEYVVGQGRAKKTICSVIFNHYQALRRRRYQDEQDQVLKEKVDRQRYARDRDAHERQSREAHVTEDEFPGHQELLQDTQRNYGEATDTADIFQNPEDSGLPQHVKIDKSNLLLIGPTGVGKTYILETLSKRLNVPFTISDCNSFTQAGYIGQDVETCIERLLIEANYDTKATEQGIIVLDEFDKIARRETMNGRDVGGEGVQQALLKLVEGTKVTISVKDNRSSRSASPTASTPYASSSSTSAPQPQPPSGKVDQYTIDTTNILFVFCGAFVGLDKHVLRRVSKPSIGFGSELRSTKSSSTSGSSVVLPSKMYSHLPHQPEPFHAPGQKGIPQTTFTPLDLTTSADLQSFGFIPELIGRMHNICAFSPLSLDELYRILTEPRNSLVAQYTALFETYPSKLFFTRRALLAIAERAAAHETGARGLKMEMERVLAEPMFDAPMPYVLVTEGCVRGTDKAGYWGKDGRLEVERCIQEEDERGKQPVEDLTFEQFREAGQSGA